MNKNQENLLEYVAEECFLFEAINYIVFGIAPLAIMDDDESELSRNSKDLYYSESFSSIFCEVLSIGECVSRMFKRNHGIGDPFFESKFQEVCYVEVFEKSEAKNMSSEEKELIVNYLKEKKLYAKKLKEIQKPFKLKLLKALRSGKINSKGFLVEKYDKEKEGFIDIYEDWTTKVSRKKFDFETGTYYDHYEDKNNKIDRESIPKKYWAFENTNFEESELVFGIEDDFYKYRFILLDFAQIYTLFPKELVFKASGLLIGDEFVSDDNSYINSRKITEEKRRGGEASYQKYKPLRNKVEELCKQALKNKPFPSALQLCAFVSKQIQTNHLDLLKDFAPYEKYRNEGGDWKYRTFYEWCNTIFKQVNPTK